MAKFIDSLYEAAIAITKQNLVNLFVGFVTGTIPKSKEKKEDTFSEVSGYPQNSENMLHKELYKVMWQDVQKKNPAWNSQKVDTQVKKELSDIFNILVDMSNYFNFNAEDYGQNFKTTMEIFEGFQEVGIFHEHAIAPNSLVLSSGEPTNTQIEEGAYYDENSGMWLKENGEPHIGQEDIVNARIALEDKFSNSVINNDAKIDNVNHGMLIENFSKIAVDIDRSSYFELYAYDILKANGIDPNQGKIVNLSSNSNYANTSVKQRVLVLEAGLLTLYDHGGNKVASFFAQTGKPGYTDKRMRDAGPIPDGKYTLYPSEISGGNVVTVIRRYVTIPGFNDGGDWGIYRVPLHPHTGTDIMANDGSNREGFFLHGGIISGTAGCIEVSTPNDMVLFNLIMQYNDPILVIVEPYYIGDFPQNQAGFYV